MAGQNPESHSKKSAPEVREGRGGGGAGDGFDDDDFLRGLPKEGNSRIVGPVKLEARISRGGMGVVYRGRHIKLDIDVAVKFLLPHLAESNPEYVIRFEREARIAAQLNNENLVRVFDVDSERNYHYVVMELVCGETARDRVARKGPLKEPETLSIILGATRGLDAAHRKGIIHRDIKPENIMIDATGVVKLADLGIAKVVEDSTQTPTAITQPGFIMGTPSFMAPEQFEGAQKVTLASDIYSMGATMYFLLTGKQPFSGTIFEIASAIHKQGFPDLRAACPDISERTLRIVQTCCARSPAARFPSAGILLREIEHSGTARINLADSRSGTVSAVAKVSTPPARRVGEIRLQLPGEEESTAETIKPGSIPAVPPAPERRRPSAAGILAILLLLAACFAGGGFFAIKYLGVSGSGGDASQKPLARPGERGQETAADRRGADGSRAQPEASASRPREGAGAQEKTAAVSLPQPGLPFADAGSGAQTPNPRSREAVDEGLRQVELGLAGGDWAGARALVEDLRKKAAGDPELELRVGKVAGDLDARQRGRALADAGKLLEGGDAGAAIRMLDGVPAWNELAPRAARLKMKALLSSTPPLEKEALIYLGSQCHQTALQASSATCQAAYEEILRHAGLPVPDDAGAAAWQARQAFLEAIPPPPGELRDLSSAHAAALAGLYGGLLRNAAREAEDLLKKGDAEGALSAIERGRVSIGARKQDAALADGVALLEKLHRESRSLQVEDADWRLVEEMARRDQGDPGLTAPQLQDHLGKVKAFLATHAGGRRVAPGEALVRQYEERLSSIQLKLAGKAPVKEKEASRPPEVQGDAVKKPAVPAVAPGPGATPEEVPEWAAALLSVAQREAAQRAAVAPAREFDLGGGHSLRLLLVPAGTFHVGDAISGPKHEVALSNPYYLSIQEVSREAFRQVMGKPAPEISGGAAAEGSAGLPAAGIAWDEAAQFCEALNRQHAARLPRGRFRLPTEAEWERACRAGSKSRFAWGDQFDEAYAWCWLNSGGKPHAAGARKPNPWGFFDLLGNVQEWCQDWHSPYAAGAAADPHGPAAGTERVVRGGTWKDLKNNLTPALRRRLEPGKPTPETGFRVALDI